MNWLDYIAAAVGGGTLSTLITTFFTRRKTAADALKTAAETEKTLTEAKHVHWQEMDRLIERLVTDSERQSRELDALQKRVAAAEASAAEAIKRSIACEARERETRKREQELRKQVELLRKQQRE